MINTKIGTDSMNMRHLLLAILFLGGTTIFAQYNPISEQQIEAKIRELSAGNLKDSIFWATIGFMRNEKMRFSKVTENTMYVNNQGIFYRIDLNEGSSIEVSCIYFMPHNRKFIPAPEDMPEDFEWVPNEHLCICSAIVGHAIVVKDGVSFGCDAVKPELNIDDNIELNCHDTETLQIYLEKYYEMGLSYKSKLKTIPIEVKKLE